MRTYPLIAALAGICLVAASCTETVPKTDYDQIVAEYNQLKANADSTRAEYVRQAEDLDEILMELTQVSGKTAEIRGDLEQGKARLTQVEQIRENIADIKEKLDNLEKKSGVATQYKKTIESLKNVIAEKEKEIEELHEVIASKDKTINDQNKTISQQHGTILSQHNTISAQQERLEEAVMEQARLLYAAGQDFEELGDMAPTVSRRKDKAKMRDLTHEMYDKAILYYTKASETGYPTAADRIPAVKEKIDQLSSKK